MTKKCKKCGGKYYCKDLCKSCYEKEVRQKPQRKEYMKKYRKEYQQNPKNKIQRNEYMRTWRQIPEVKDRIKELRKQPKRKANKKNTPTVFFYIPW